MFGIFFTDAESVTCYQDVMACDVERFKRFFHMMLDEGVYLAPSAFEAGFMFVGPIRRASVASGIRCRVNALSVQAYRAVIWKN